MARSTTNSNGCGNAAVIDLAARRRARHRAQPEPSAARRATYTYGFTRAQDDTSPEPVLVRLTRQLEKQGLNPAERLALFVALPDDLWNQAWAQLREHIDRERAA